MTCESSESSDTESNSDQSDRSETEETMDIRLLTTESAQPSSQTGDYEQPWHIFHTHRVKDYREYSKEQLLSNVKNKTFSEETNSRGSYISKRLELLMSSTYAHRLAEWRRTDGEGVSNKGIDKLLEIIREIIAANILPDDIPLNTYYLYRTHAE